MNELILNNATERHLKAFLQKPSHALLLSGPAKIGKGYIARVLSEKLLGLEPDSFSKYPYIKVVTPAEGKAISIESIRELEHFLSLKVASAQQLRRIVLIEDAHTLTQEAQNALLKLLEEPAKDTVIILTAVNERALLPTIRSRTQKIVINQPPKELLTSHFGTKGFSEAQISQAMLLGGGLPSLVSDLLVDDQQHSMVEAAKLARQILTSSTYERLLVVDELSKQRQLIKDLCFLLGQMAHMALVSSKDSANALRWQKILKASYQAQEQLLYNSQPKLLLSNLMLQV